MDSIPLVESQIDDGQRLLDQFEHDGFEYTVACWVKPSDEDLWSLYVVSPVVDRLGVAVAYGEAHRSLRALGEAWVTYSNLKLLGEHHPIAKRVTSVAGNSSRPVRFFRVHMGTETMDETYIYPPQPSAPADAPTAP